MKGDALDPKALIAEAYRIEGISLEECRSIFLDWALSLPEGTDEQAALAALLARHGVSGHPMTRVMSDGRSPAAPRRRGGRAARRN
ncbi:hypothetical protein [Alloyangia pacifica]|uniref:Uncharacterized protein n=1 Tax=Alloyangia pacifica TaxID=311180 RepID=A0A1I6VWP7_9RHOB|nr:hypothetical protein [Alloyangia pacifica]SDI22604.1 hypothetical protein SAMN04488245_113150 [Alloyangia pacifica]SFT18021.1 hypothetical protein SAMN04488050_11373 [Alloyangia pacifica]